MRRVAPSLLVFSFAGAAAPAFAGDVSASVAGGTLTLSGGAAADAVSIDQIGVANAKEFRVVPGPGVTVNGSNSPQKFSPITKDIEVALGTGPDSVLIVDSKLPRDVVTASVAGNATTVEFRRCRIARDVVGRSTGGNLGLDFRQTIVKRDVRLIGGAQPDDVLFTEQSQVFGDVLVRGGGGSDSLMCIQSTIAGSVRFDGGAANDVIQLALAAVGGELRFASGDGPDDLQMTNSAIGRMRIDLGGGDDGIVVSATAVHGPVRAALGGDANDCSCDHLTVAGKLDIRGGSGADAVNLLEGCFVDGDLKVSLGDGTNELITDTIVVAKGVRARSGIGADSLKVLSSSIRGDVRLAPSPTAAITADTAELTDSVVRGNVRFDAKSALSATIADSEVARSVAARFGAGSNAIAIIGSVVRGVSIDGAGGDDSVQVSTHTHVLEDVTAKLDGGANTVKLLACSIGRDVFAKTGAGADTFDFTGAVIAGKTKVVSGGGADVGP